MDQIARTSAARVARWQDHEPTERVTVRLPTRIVERLKATGRSISEQIRDRMDDERYPDTVPLDVAAPKGQ